jgi:uncharacterized protein (TIGR00369 family)
MDEVRYGVASPEEMAGLTGREMLEAMLTGRLPAPPIARTLDFALVEVDKGMAVFEGQPGPHLLNPLGMVHGGWALTLIDSATGCALHTMLPAGTGYSTIETKANMTRPIRAEDGKVRCEGKVVSRGRQVATAEARLTGENGKLLAHGTSTLMIFAAR